MKIKMNIGPQSPKRKQDIKPIKRAPNNPPPKHTIKKQTIIKKHGRTR